MLHDGRRNRLETRRTRDLLGDARQQSLRVVTLAEEAAIQVHQPRLAPGPDHEERRSERHVHVPPPAPLQQRADRLIAVLDDVPYEQRTKKGNQRIDEATRQRISQPLPHDQPHIEQPVPQDRVRQRRRHRQHDQREHRHPRAGKYACAWIAPEPADHTEPSDRSEGRTRDQHTDAASVRQGLCRPAMRDQ